MLKLIFLYLITTVSLNEYLSPFLKKGYFCEDNNHDSGFMVDLTMGYCHEHPTMVKKLIFKVVFSDCGPHLLSQPDPYRAPPSLSVICAESHLNINQ